MITLSILKASIIEDLNEQIQDRFRVSTSHSASSDSYTIQLWYTDCILVEAFISAEIEDIEKIKSILDQFLDKCTTLLDKRLCKSVEEKK